MEEIRMIIDSFFEKATKVLSKNVGVTEELSDVIMSVCSIQANLEFELTSRSEKEVKEEKKGSEKTPVKEPETPKENAKEPAQEAKATDSNDAAPVFKIQISIGRAKLSPNDRQFKGLTGVECYREGFYKYTVGNTTDYNDIARQRREILSKFPEAFIIAFKDGKKMNINEAISEFKARKK